MLTFIDFWSLKVTVCLHNDKTILKIKLINKMEINKGHF